MDDNNSFQIKLSNAVLSIYTLSVVVNITSLLIRIFIRDITFFEQVSNYAVITFIACTIYFILEKLITKDYKDLIFFIVVLIAVILLAL
ncbi:hypothetical protein [Macrococcus animalis]|uniref:hypothetical protein n=1 Tax=Macrococcus animalis TaxID=3395467 RepID=UPI0039BE0C6A